MLQAFSLDEGRAYDDDDRYLFIFHDRGSLDRVREGKSILPSDGIIQAFNDVEDYWKGWSAPRDKGEYFVTIHQKADLLESGFREVEVIDSKECEWYQKWDNDFEEYRINKEVSPYCIGYFCMNDKGGRRDV